MKDTETVSDIAVLLAHIEALLRIASTQIGKWPFIQFRRYKLDSLLQCTNTNDRPVTSASPQY